MYIVQEAGILNCICWILCVLASRRVEVNAKFSRWNILVEIYSEEDILTVTIVERGSQQERLATKS